MLKPALWGEGVKKGLNILMAKGPSELIRYPFVMFVVIPFWMTMLAVYHCVTSLVAYGALFDLRRTMSLVDGSSVGCLSLMDLAKWITFLKVGYNFFQTCSSPFVSVPSSNGHLLFFLAL